MSPVRVSFARYASALSLAAFFVVSAPLYAQQPKPAKQPKAQEPVGTTYEPNVPALTNNYPLTEDSKPHPGTPQGKEFKFTLTDSKIFPNTGRAITVYVPAQYKPSQPAALWVELDGLKGPTMSATFDNLIAAKQIPVLIAVGVSPGMVPSAQGPEDQRLQRSYEFDALSDRLARFIIEEVIPQVEAHKTPDGLDIHISRDPNDHAISGGSTGGIGAFTAAFQRPDYFRRVYTIIGTFVGMRGGEQEYVQVRKTEPLPLRIFMNDGANDEWPGGPEMGDWHMANLTMNRALDFAGYDLKHVWGQGSHNGGQGAQIFPDVLRWLYRDYPAPIVANAPGNPRLAELLLPNEPFKPASNPGKEVLGAARALGPDGKLYQAEPTGGFFATPPAGGSTTLIAKDLRIRGLTVRSNGDVYATALTPSGDGELWRITPDGKETKLDTGIRGPAGLGFLPDGLWLLVAESQGQHILDYRVRPDGTLDAREAMYQVSTPLTADDAGTTALAFDTQGWLYAATRMGIQVFDRNGRVTGILPLPGAEAATAVTFGGPDLHTLYVASASGKLYTRRVKTTGAPSPGAPIKLPHAGAG